jgi:uncharacterized radical SAM protein YgiQ
MSRNEMDALGWDELDILLISGDAYVDHPSFGVALLGRWLQAHGYRVGIVAQPRWDTAEDIKCMGRPRLFAGVTAGAIDSMLAHYTAFRKKRSDDAYTPGGQSGTRPNHASMVYTGLVRQAFKGLPVILGGVEASLRRATHYDFWSNKLKRSILLDSKADLLVFGMGERAILEIANRLRARAEFDAPVKKVLRNIPGTVFAVNKSETWEAPGTVALREFPSHEAIQEDAKLLMKATIGSEHHTNEANSWAMQRTGDRRLVFAPPSPHLTTAELDRLYDLPFTRLAHPIYDQPIPADEMIRFSVTSHRGCSGGCTFCSIGLHQGRDIRSRSEESIRKEVEAMTKHPKWKGSVSDVGGPSANMWGAKCSLPAGDGPCRRPSCITPKICKFFKTEQDELAKMLDGLTHIQGVKHVRVASGVVYDLALKEKSYLSALVTDFVGGQLKIAPEHQNNRVLELMRKPSFDNFEEFLTTFENESRSAEKEQYVIPYLMSGFPGCRNEDMQDLSNWLKSRGWRPQQVQCFVPTPGAVATAMFYCGIDTKGKPIEVARTDAERLAQHRILMPDVGKPPKKTRQLSRR